MLKGWSLIGDAYISLSELPGVAIAYALQLPYALGAFSRHFMLQFHILWIKVFRSFRRSYYQFYFTTFSLLVC